MRHHFFLLLLISSIFSSCTQVIVTEGPSVQVIDAPAMTDLVIWYSNTLKDEKRLDLEDSRIEYDDFITRISLDYSSQRLLTVNEARLLLVEVVEDFLELLNNDPRLQGDLFKYPFTADNLWVRINFESFYGIYLDPLYVGAIWLQCGCTYIYAFDRKDNNIDWEHHRFEPYFKSKEIALIKQEADLALDAKRKSRLPKEALSEIRYSPMGNQLPASTY